MFPTLADADRRTWPTTHRVYPAPAHLEGDVSETILCTCHRTVPPNEMVDLREIAAATRLAIGVTQPVLCMACFHHAELLGQIHHAAIARALGMHGAVIAALEAGTREALRHGWHRVTDRNRHLL